MKTSKYIFYTVLLLFVTIPMGCQHAINAPPSQQFLKGLQIGDQYAKKDALGYPCIEKAFLSYSRPRGYLQQHLLKFKQEKAPSDFIEGFSRGYETAYRDYIDAYCYDID